MSYRRREGKLWLATVQSLSAELLLEFRDGRVFRVGFFELLERAFRFRFVARFNQRLRQFGGSIGGPLPFLNFGEGGPFAISGKDKLFFYFAYEGLTNKSNNTSTAFVETAQYRNLVRAQRPNGVTARVFGTPGRQA